jgi:Tfp pilus assembly protein PilX
VVLAAVLVCLLVISLVGAGMVQTMLTSQRDTRLQHDRLQASWLAESGMDRAIARLHSDVDYNREVWQVDPNELDGRRAAAVEIVVESAGDATDMRRIVVVARLGDGPEQVAAWLDRTVSTDSRAVSR